MNTPEGIDGYSPVYRTRMSSLALPRRQVPTIADLNCGLVFGSASPQHGRDEQVPVNANRDQVSYY